MAVWLFLKILGFVLRGLGVGVGAFRCLYGLGTELVVRVGT